MVCLLIADIARQDHHCRISRAAAGATLSLTTSVEMIPPVLIKKPISGGSSRMTAISLGNGDWPKLIRRATG